MLSQTAYYVIISTCRLHSESNNDAFIFKIKLGLFLAKEQNRNPSLSELKESLK